MKNIRSITRTLFIIVYPKSNPNILYNEFSFFIDFLKITRLLQGEIFIPLTAHFLLSCFNPSWNSVDDAHALRYHIAERWYGDGKGTAFELRGGSSSSPWRLNLFSSLAETRTSQSVVTVSGMDPELTIPYTLYYFNNRHADAAVIIIGSQWSFSDSAHRMQITSR